MCVYVCVCVRTGFSAISSFRSILDVMMMICVKERDGVVVVVCVCENTGSWALGTKTRMACVCACVWL